MKFANTLTLGLALCVPALVQHVQAETTAAEDTIISVIETNINLQIQFIEGLDTLIDEEAATDATITKLKETNTQLTKLQDKIGALNDEELSVLSMVMSDEEYLQDAKEFSELVQEMLDIFKEIDYLDSAALKEVCTEFAAICDYKM